MSKNANTIIQSTQPLVIRQICPNPARERVGYHVPSHVHQVYQWYCVLGGVVDMNINGVNLKLHPGQSIIISPGTERSPRSDSGRKLEYMFVFFEKYGLELTQVENTVLTADNDIWLAIHKLWTESLNPRDGMTKFYCENLARNILIDLIRTAFADKHGEKYLAGRNSEIIQRIDMFMRTKLSEPITREMLAEFVHMSPPHLARIFSAETGMTLLEYLTRIRIERAKTLLAESSLSVTQIAMDVGYESVSHFSQLFKKISGFAPLKYRFRRS